MTPAPEGRQMRSWSPSLRKGRGRPLDPRQSQRNQPSGPPPSSQRPRPAPDAGGGSDRRGQDACGQFAPSGLLRDAGKGRHAEDQHKVAPVDRATGGGIISRPRDRPSRAAMRKTMGTQIAINPEAANPRDAGRGQGAPLARRRAISQSPKARATPVRSRAAPTTDSAARAMAIRFAPDGRTGFAPRGTAGCPRVGTATGGAVPRGRSA